MLKLSFLSFSLFLAVSLAYPRSHYYYPKKCTGKATYEITLFNAMTSNRFGKLPPQLHLSEPIVWSQREQYSAFQLGKPASKGVQIIAEEGNATALYHELIYSKMATGITRSVDRIFEAKKDTFKVNIDCEYSCAGFASMIGPSPDWFVGKTCIPMIKNGKFIDSVTIPLCAYDSGTDSGTTLLAENQPTKPKGVITMFKGKPFDGRVVAYVSARRV